MFFFVVFFFFDDNLILLLFFELHNYPYLFIFFLTFRV